MNNKVEILAPCGSMAAFKAAINAGADACYLAGRRFGARAYADNFDQNELCDVIDKAHLKGVKVYMTVNTLLKNVEINSLYCYLKPMYEAGLDAVILQDMGAFSVVKELFPELPIHASTQMNICSSNGAALLKELGASRVIPARELTLDEIRSIKEKVDVEIETFVHGAMCYSYSGRCLLSSMIGDRSGNRGRCAQPCRKKYNGKYLMSMKDMCTLNLVPEIIKAGVDSLKIEGRMKGEYYTAAVVSAYKEVANDYYNGCFSEKKCMRLTERLADVFNRGGFVSGYYYPSDDMIDIESPGHKGVLVGKVTSAGHGKVNIKTSKSINKKDVLLIKTKDKIAIELTSDKAVDAYKNIELNSPKSGTILLDSEVYRKINNKIMTDLKNDILNNDKLMPIKINAFIKVGEKLRMEIVLDNITATAIGGVVEEAKSTPVDTEIIRDKITALGDSGYYPEEVGIFNDNKSFVSFSELKSLRRKLISLLEERVLSDHRRTARQRNFDNIKKENYEKNEIKEKYIHFSVENEDIASKLLEVLSISKNDKVKYLVSFDVDCFTINRLCELAKDFSSFSKVAVAFPYIHREQDNNFYDELLNDKSFDDLFDTFYVRNIDDISLLRTFNKKIILASSLYCYNDKAVGFFDKLIGGSDKDKIIEMSHELSIDENNDILLAENISGEIYAYGHETLMLTAQDPGGRNYLLKDERNGIFKFIKNNNLCYNRILDNRLTVLDSALSGFITDKRYAYLKVDLLDESIAEITSIIDQIVNPDNGNELLVKNRKKLILTEGHYNSSIL